MADITDLIAGIIQAGQGIAESKPGKAVRKGVGKAKRGIEAIQDITDPEEFMGQVLGGVIQAQTGVKTGPIDLKGLRKSTQQDAAAPAPSAETATAAPPETEVKQKVGDEEVTVKKKGGLGSFNIFNTRPDANLNPGAQALQDILSFTGTGIKRATESQNFGVLTDKDRMDAGLDILKLKQLTTGEATAIANQATYDPDGALRTLDVLKRDKDSMVSDLEEQEILDFIKGVALGRQTKGGNVFGQPGRGDTAQGVKDKLASLNQRLLEKGIL